MIQPLRQRHRRTFAVLGVILPVAFVTAIAARRPVPTLASTPSALVRTSPQFAITLWSRDDLFAKTPVRIALVRERAGDGRFAVELRAPKDFVKPDLLVYWVARGSDVVGTIPDDAVLLGGFSASAPLTIPAGAAQSSGVLALYSLADNEVVDVSHPFSAAAGE